MTFQPGVGILTVYPGSLDYFISLEIFSTKILFHQPITFYPNLLLGGGEFVERMGIFVKLILCFRLLYYLLAVSLDEVYGY